MKCEKIIAKLFNEVPVFCYKCKSVTILGRSRLLFLAARVGENAAILGYPDDAFETKYTKFLY